MKYAKFNDYGDYNQVIVEEMEVPKVMDDMVLVRIHAASINMLDVRVVTGEPEMVKNIVGLPKPILNKLGSDFSGEVVGVGDNVNEFMEGDEVFGQLAMNQDGSFAEYALVPKNQLAIKPHSISHSVASTVPMAGVTALQGLRLLDVKKDTTLLIYGASGGVGTFVIQIAKALGAHVTAVCSTRNIKYAEESGADIVIDYKIDEWFNEDIKYDAIFVANGYNPFQMYLDSIKPNGKILLNVKTDQIDKEVEEAKEKLKEKGIELSSIYAKINKEDYNILATMLDNNDLHPIIDKQFDLVDIQEAYKYFMSGQAIGKTVIIVR